MWHFLSLFIFADISMIRFHIFGHSDGCECISLLFIWIQIYICIFLIARDIVWPFHVSVGHCWVFSTGNCPSSLPVFPIGRHWHLSLEKEKRRPWRPGAGLVLSSRPGYWTYKFCIISTSDKTPQGPWRIKTKTRTLYQSWGLNTDNIWALSKLQNIKHPLVVGENLSCPPPNFLAPGVHTPSTNPLLLFNKHESRYCCEEILQMCWKSQISWTLR